MLLPLVALLLPFLRVMPSVYRWRVRSKIYRWYRELEELDPEIHGEKDPARMEKHLERLNRIENQVSQISVPLAYREEVYDLRLHIDLLRKKLRDMDRSVVGPSCPSIEHRARRKDRRGPVIGKGARP